LTGDREIDSSIVGGGKVILNRCRDHDIEIVTILQRRTFLGLS